MKVREITPSADTDPLLPGAHFADAFQIEIGDRDLDARRAAERMMARQPWWAEALVSLRNFLMAPLGLRTSGAGLVPPRDMIGIFPVVSQTPDRLIAGFNDRHLDFRVVIASYFNSTFSVGYAEAVENHGRTSSEVMVSLKLL